MSSICIPLAPDLHRSLRLIAADKGTSLRMVIAQLLTSGAARELKGHLTINTVQKVSVAAPSARSKKGQKP